MIDECPICDRELGIDDGDHVGRCLDKRIATAIAEARKACHVESQPDGYWLVLKNKSGEAAINLDGPSRGPIVRAVIKEAGG